MQHVVHGAGASGVHLTPHRRCGEAMQQPACTRDLMHGGNLSCLNLRFCSAARFVIKGHILVRFNTMLKTKRSHFDQCFYQAFHLPICGRSPSQVPWSPRPRPSAASG